MTTSILLDTNIIIYREDNDVIKKDIQELSKILYKEDFKIYVHENSFKDINNDKNDKRKEIISSKMNTYPILKSKYNFQDDKEFLSIVGYKENTHDFVDNSLLYSILKGECTFLITNDNGIHKKAKKLDHIEPNFSERIFNTQELINNFKEYTPKYPYIIEKTTMDYLNINDPIFDKLKRDYEEFEGWFKSKQSEKRNCLVYNKPDKSHGALLIYKKEEETIHLDNKILPIKNRIKIATMIVTSEGYKIGEFLLKWIIDYALKNNMDEIYLTHFEEEEDSLIYLIKEYGFQLEGKNSRGEVVYVKSINRSQITQNIENEIHQNSPLKIDKKYYPYFYDGLEVKKFIVPIKEKYHEKLFLSNPEQSALFGHITISNNTIKKAYLSKARINVKEGDVLLFYETPKKGISQIGIVESSNKDLNIENINKTVGKRSVYSQNELKNFEGKNLVILFIHTKEFDKISYETLKKEGIIKGAPQSIQSLEHEKYLKLKKMIK